MRRLVSSLIILFLLSLLSGSVFAGKNQHCEDEKETLQAYGLYGLCNAYWNTTNPNAQARIMENFNARAPEGYVMPGTEPLKPAVFCPCWSDAELANTNSPWDCQIEDNFALVSYDDAKYQYSVTPTMCGYSDFATPEFKFSPTTPEENAVCLDVIVELIVADFPDC